MDCQSIPLLVVQLQDSVALARRYKAEYSAAPKHHPYFPRLPPTPTQSLSSQQDALSSRTATERWGSTRACAMCAMYYQ